MAIPDYQSLMLPMLKFLSDREIRSMETLRENLGKEFALSMDDKALLLPSGRQPVFANRVGWAKTYLVQAGLLQSPARGKVQITERGVALLGENPPRIDVRLLERFPEFVEFRQSRVQNKSSGTSEKISLSGNPLDQSPEEALEIAYQTVRENLAKDVLNKIKECSPHFFEKLVVDVLVKMGYGGTTRDAGSAVGKCGDEGIDGVIKEDKLGLDVIYIQAKRWASTVVGRPELQKFVGALQGQRAKKGIFITTSAFSDEAKEYVGKLDIKIVLIDGDLLAQLMMDHRVGVNILASYEIGKIDSDYFVED